MVLEVLQALARRWYVVLVGLSLTAGLTYGVFRASPPEYHARGLVLLLPSESAVGKGGNPFLQLSGLEQPAGILVASFSSAPAREEVRALSPTADYQIGIDDTTRGPVIAVDVTAASDRETLATLDHIMKRIPEELARLQKEVDAPADAAIGSMSLTVDTKPEVSRAGTIRLSIAALMVGLLGTAFLAYGLDAWVQRRSLRKATSPNRGRLRRRSASPKVHVNGSRDVEASGTLDVEVAGADATRERAEPARLGRGS